MCGFFLFFFAVEIISSTFVIINFNFISIMKKNLSFGEALEAVKSGALISREGWNGKGMFVFMRPSDELSVDMIVNKVKSLPDSVKKFFAGHCAWHDEEKGTKVNPEELKVNFTAYLCMYSADGSVVNGWLASQTDMLANDWCVLK